MTDPVEDEPLAAELAAYWAKRFPRTKQSEGEPRPDTPAPTGDVARDYLDRKFAKRDPAIRQPR